MIALTEIATINGIATDAETELATDMTAEATILIDGIEAVRGKGRGPHGADHEEAEITETDGVDRENVILIDVDEMTLPIRENGGESPVENGRQMMGRPRLAS
jgi:hypothetical protein